VPDTVAKGEAETLLLMRPVKEGSTEADTEEEALLVFVFV
jgi:hypothetical protein